MKNTTVLCLLLSFLMLHLFSCKEATHKAEVVITNATIWTGNTVQPYAEALAIAKDTIMAIGSTIQIEKYINDATEVINAKNGFITPGFIDSHVHLMMGGNALLSVELRDANTPKEFIKRIAEYAGTLQPGEWVLEGNWDHTLWGGELPKKEWIDSTTKETPVALYRLDGHMVLANSLALKIAGIDKDTPNIPGGEIVRDNMGNPTGILKDNAMNVLLGKIPEMTQKQKGDALRSAMDYLVSKGVTSVVDVDSLGTYAIAKEFKDANKLKLRIYALNPLAHWKKRFGVINEQDVWLKTGGLKGFVDGSLGSHTAAFFEPYLDKPSNSGLFITPETDLYRWISQAEEDNLQVMIHAIGDKAIQSTLNIYDSIFRKYGSSGSRHRIEHAQHLAQEDINRFASLGVIASVQPYHAIDDGRWAAALIGPERTKTTYAFKSLFDANAIVVFGSDWPVAPATPLDGIYAAVTRRTLDGKNPEGWVPEQKITVQQSLLAYTKNAAYATFDENHKGTLETGKLADFVILSQDLTKIDKTLIRDVKVLQTFVGGKKVYDHENSKIQ